MSLHSLSFEFLLSFATKYRCFLYLAMSSRSLVLFALFLSLQRFIMLYENSYHGVYDYRVEP